MKVKGEAGGSSSSPPGSAKRSLPEDNDGEATVSASANKKLRVDFVGKGRVGSEEPPLVDVRSSA